jgi:glycerol-3-phosphate acyltransferase PlsX
MLDIGANADCKPEVLAQFGQIGSIFAQYTFQIDRPRVALMNIGEEEQKGSLTSQATYPLLKQNKRINFIGNIEGKDLFTNKADVIVLTALPVIFCLNWGNRCTKFLKREVSRTIL